MEGASMGNRLFGIFSGAQLTFIVCTAIVAPTALYGAVSYSRVQIIGANGQTPSVANGGLATNDVFARYRNDPRNLRDIFITNNGASCNTTQQWPVPAGSAFVITAITGYMVRSNTAIGFVGINLFAGLNCSGTPLTTHYTSATSDPFRAPLALTFGPGIPVPAGSTLSVLDGNNSGLMHVHGYLVPASLVAAGQIVTPTLRGAAASTRSSYRPQW
jgi:hypothetical protein